MFIYSELIERPKLQAWRFDGPGFVKVAVNRRKINISVPF